jgi:trehalose 6-phosphate synthase/trehalose 6-phosphate phosphatase
LDPAKVKPWAGVPEFLEAIQKTGRTRLAVISGRPARDVAAQLNLHKPIEIWGLHGSERLLPSGELELEKLQPEQQKSLENARTAISRTALKLRMEHKANAVVVHWRGKSLPAAEAARKQMLALLEPYTRCPGLGVLQFDGGIELRAGRDKGDAVRMLVSSMSPDSPVAYLGDDTTDEDAFRALAGRGLSVLVRREWRPGAAQHWLRPPAELREFLRSWFRAVAR